MSRPADPSWTTIAFATDVNYAAGAMPWSGLPTKVVPAGMVTGFTPKSAVAAQSVNYLWNYCTDRIAQIKATEQAMLDFSGQLPVNNWGPRIAMASAISCVWDSFYQRLWLLGTPASVTTAIYSENHTSVSANKLTTPGAELAVDGACDAAGNLVVSTGTRFVYEVNGASFAGTKPDVGGVAGAVGYSVQFEPITGRYVWIGYDGAANTIAKFSTNRTAWTVGGTLIVGAAALVNGSVATRKATGVILAARVAAGTAVVTLFKSTNGGTSFATTTPITMSFINANPALTCDEDTATWYLTGSNGVKSEVWKSTDDGTTWARITLLSATSLTYTVCVGAMLAAFAGPVGAPSPRLVYSVDAGTTWKYSTMNTGTVSSSLVRTPNALVAIDSSGFYVSARFGKSQTAALT